MSNEANGPYKVEQDAESRQFVVKTPLGKCLYWSEYPGDCHRMAEQINAAHSQALTSQSARAKELECALGQAIELLDGCVENHNFDFGSQFDEIKAALTPKEPQQ